VGGGAGAAKGAARDTGWRNGLVGPKAHRAASAAAAAGRWGCSRCGDAHDGGAYVVRIQGMWLLAQAAEHYVFIPGTGARVHIAIPIAGLACLLTLVALFAVVLAAAFIGKRNQ